MTRPKFRAGDCVAVKSEREILATLDGDGKLEGLPFSAEMWAFCGRRFTVRCHVNRIQIDGTGVRGIRNTVILSEVRCHGQAHHGCERACHLLFKEAWLRNVPPTEMNRVEVDEPSSSPDAAGTVRSATSPCQGQGTVLVGATTPLPEWDPRQYIDDLFSRTYSAYDVATICLFRLNRKWRVGDAVWSFGSRDRTLRNLARMALFVLRQNLEWLLRLSVPPEACPAEAIATQAREAPTLPEPALALHPGDVVEVRSREEILATLNEKGKHRGLVFCGAMLRHCGRRYRVLAPVSRLISEQTDKEVPRVTRTYTLEGALCDGVSFRGCPRACYWMWRDVWLRKVEAPEK